jgi:formylglycine-generating enzyme required for sulfatase activity
VGELGTFGECHTATDNGPALVGSKPGDMSRPTATGPGVMDLGANLSEWTLDLSGGLCNPYWRVPVTPIDPVQPIAEYGPQRHTVKGGAWNAAADTLSVGQRTGIDDGDIVRNGSWIGFRCVRTGAP